MKTLTSCLQARAKTLNPKTPNPIDVVDLRDERNCVDELCLQAGQGTRTKERFRGVDIRQEASGRAMMQNGQLQASVALPTCKNQQDFLPTSEMTPGRGGPRCAYFPHFDFCMSCQMRMQLPLSLRSYMLCARAAWRLQLHSSTRQA